MPWNQQYRGENAALVTRVGTLEAKNNQLQFQEADLKEYKDRCMDEWVKLDASL
jgi:BMFP domain-containing protein YqiC